MTVPLDSAWFKENLLDNTAAATRESLLSRRGVASLVLTALVMSAFAVPLGVVPQTVKAAVLYDSGNPTPAEQLVLEYVNRARSNPVVEGQRLGIDIHEGLQNPSLVGSRPPLAMSRLLLSIASAHSQDMYNLNYFSHNDSNGTTPFQRMTKAGYNYVRAGENMAAGTEITAAELEDFMMVDAGTPGRPHRVNLLDIFPYPCSYPPCAYYEVGVGYYEGTTPNSIGNAFITEDFGANPNAGPFLLGVVYNEKNSNNFYDIGEGIAGVTITPSDGSYYAVSSSAGGYAIPIGTSGTITVTASGPGFSPITKTVALTGVNVKLDFTTQASSVTSSTTSPQTTTQTSYQSVTQTTSTSTTFQISPSSFIGMTSPGTITACGSTHTNGQSATSCGNSFTATANLPTPFTGWRFDHWVWTGGIMCSSISSTSVSCTASGSGGFLMAVYGAQVTFATNPASPALIGWGSCSNQGHGNGDSLFSTGYGSVAVTACYVPSDYTLSSWSCSGGLACSGSNNPVTATFNGPGTITLNLQPQTLTSTTSTTSSALSTSNSTVITSVTYSTPEFAFNQPMMITAILAVFLSLFRRKASRKR